MTGPDVVRTLQKLGFVVDHVTGSHVILIAPDRQRTVVPVHGPPICDGGPCMPSANKQGSPRSRCDAYKHHPISPRG